MTVRRLPFAFIVAIAVSVGTNSIAEAAVLHLGRSHQIAQGSVGWSARNYDAAPKPASEELSQRGHARPGRRAASSEIGTVWANKPSVLVIAATEEAASSGTTLFRAVGQDEAADITNTGGYRIAGNSVRGGKYFYPTQEQAQSLVDRGWATQVSSATFPHDAIDAATPLNIASEGPGYYIPQEFFPYGPVSFLGGPG